eukprot:3931925-Rhodomonas_salina.3
MPTVTTWATACKRMSWSREESLKRSFGICIATSSVAFHACSGRGGGGAGGGEEGGGGSTPGVPQPSPAQE